MSKTEIIGCVRVLQASEGVVGNHPIEQGILMFFNPLVVPMGERLVVSLGVMTSGEEIFIDVDANGICKFDPKQEKDFEGFGSVVINSR